MTTTGAGKSGPVAQEGTAVGVGLGLAICKAIITAHGGDIVALRREEGGSRFEFTLPVTEPAE